MSRLHYLVRHARAWAGGVGKTNDERNRSPPTSLLFVAVSIAIDGALYDAGGLKVAVGQERVDLAKEGELSTFENILCQKCENRPASRMHAGQRLASGGGAMAKAKTRDQKRRRLRSLGDSTKAVGKKKGGPAEERLRSTGNASVVRGS